MIMSFTGLPSQSTGAMPRADIHRATNMPDSTRYSAGQKAEVHAVLEAILDRLDELSRGPDLWEETCLVLALNFLEAGLYDHARKELDDCVQPVSERSPWRQRQVNRNPPRYSVVRLRTRLEGVKLANRYGT